MVGSHHGALAPVAVEPAPIPEATAPRATAQPPVPHTTEARAADRSPNAIDRGGHAVGKPSHRELFDAGCASGDAERLKLSPSLSSHSDLLEQRLLATERWLDEARGRHLQHSTARFE